MLSRACCNIFSPFNVASHSLTHAWSVRSAPLEGYAEANSTWRTPVTISALSRCFLTAPLVSMASRGVNSAVTKDGETYNKLQRPEDYLIPTTSRPQPIVAASPLATHPSKRKRGQDAATGSKRVRAEHGVAQPNIWGPVGECGMRTMLPGVDDDEQLSDDSTREALAYLRSVR